MIGPLINAIGILLGGILALTVRKPIPARYQLALKIVLGVYTLWFGLKLSWDSVNGSFRQGTREICIVLLAMALGKLAGKLMRLQKFSNSIGRHATQVLSTPQAQQRSNEGFVMATGLFCAGPLALLASVQAGLTGFSPLFIVKAGIDGLATYAFCATLGWSVILSAVPVLAFEAALIRIAQFIAPALRNQSWPGLDATNATDGLLIFCVSMIILELKKVEVADYFPSLVLAPLFTWLLWR